MEVTARLTESDFGRLLETLAADAPWMAARAINRSLASGETIGARLVAQDMKLKVGDVKKFVRVQNATKTTLVGRIYASNKPLPLYDFNARPTSTGVTANTTRRQYPGAFIATMKSGHVGVFRRRVPSESRKGKRRGAPGLKIFELFYVSIAHVFTKYVPQIATRVKEQLAKNVAHELKRATQRS